jgi:cyanate permease
MIATSFGSGVSPWLSGLVHDRTGSYELALLMSLVAFALAMVAAWMLPEFREGQQPLPSAAPAGA